jgi:hypothetical protein
MVPNSSHKDILNTLSAEEKALALSILKEIKDNGESKTLSDLVYEDYEEIPVSIEEFLTNPIYLGKGLINQEGKFTVFPYWVETLKKIFPTNIDTAYNTLILSGAIGLGKSFVAVIAMLYMLYRMLCLKDPYLHYGLQSIDKITFSFINITLDAAKGVAWDKCQQLLQSSSWFLSKGKVNKKDIPEWQPSKNIELLYGSLPRHVIGRAVFASFADEVSFQPNQDINAQKEKAKKLISTVDARMQSRFMKGEKLPTLHILASSKRTDQSFLESYIEMKKKNDSKTTLIIDEPQWVIRTDKDSPRKFNVAVGNKFLNNELLPLNITKEELQQYINRGYTILKVPMGYYESFRDDLDIALTDIAGISTSNSSRYISGERWNKLINKNISNPFTKEIITVGNSPDDTAQYYDFFDISKISSEIKARPMYVHLDMSISGDKTGIAGVIISGKKQFVEEGRPPSKDLSYRLVFNFSVKAPKGHQISFEKNRQFIFWLREQGFNIKGVSTDTFQSYDTGQTLKVKGFNYDILSVDRVEKTEKGSICRPYQYFKTTIYDERLEIYETELLAQEVAGLKRDNNGKIDHDITGINCLVGSTEIKLTDGRNVRIDELVKEFQSGKTNYVYSFNEVTKVIEPKPIENAFKSGTATKLVRITLDNGEFIECTPEHRFMLRDGSYIEAQFLMPYDSLMPLYTKFPSKGALSKYRLYYEPMEDKWHYEHRRFATEVFDEKYLVHHKDCNKLNNNPDNLIWMSQVAHQRVHAEMQTGAQSEDAKNKRRMTMKNIHAKNKDNEKWWLRHYSGTYEERVEKYNKNQQKKQDKQNRIKAMNELYDIDFESLDKSTQRRYLASWANYVSGRKLKNLNLKNDIELERKEKKQYRLDVCEYYNVDINTLSSRELQALQIKYLYETKENYKENIAKSVSENHKKGKYKKVVEVISRRRWFNNGEQSIYIDKDEVPPEGFVPGRIMNWLNHKVKSIEFIDRVEDVFDLTIKDNPNFATSSGVIVHNSKDSADAVCGAIYNASQHAEEYAFEWGESLDTITKTNKNNEQQVTIDFEEELKLLDPLAKFNDKEIAEEQSVQNKQKSENTHQSTIPKPQQVPNIYIHDGIIVW